MDSIFSTLTLIDSDDFDLFMNSQFISKSILGRVSVIWFSKLWTSDFLKRRIIFIKPTKVMFDIVEMHLDPFWMPMGNVLSRTVILCHRGHPGGLTIFLFFCYHARVNPFFIQVHVLFFVLKNDRFLDFLRAQPRFLHHLYPIGDGHLVHVST